MAAGKPRKSKVSIRQLQGIVPLDPNREPVTIEDMNEAIRWSACRGNVPDEILAKQIPDKLKHILKRR